MRKLLISACVIALSAVPVSAGSKTKVSILFQDFPKGTKCDVSGASGNTKIDKKKGHPRVSVRGHGEVGTYFCALPDGRKVKTDVNSRLPETARSAGITVYPDGTAYATVSTTDGQLLSLQFSKTIKGL